MLEVNKMLYFYDKVIKLYATVNIFFILVSISRYDISFYILVIFESEHEENQWFTFKKIKKI